MKSFLTVAFERDTMAASAKAALLVGSILALINYGDRIFLHGNMQTMDWIKMAITYFIPYGVATYGAAKYALMTSGDKEGPTTEG